MDLGVISVRYARALLKGALAEKQEDKLAYTRCIPFCRAYLHRIVEAAPWNLRPMPLPVIAYIHFSSSFTSFLIIDTYFFYNYLLPVDQKD